MDKEILIKQFQDICNTTEANATFFLEATNYNVDEAVAQFFGESADMQEQDNTSASPASNPPLPTATGAASSHSQKKSKSSSSTASRGNSRLATIASLQNRDSSEDSDSEEEGQAFFVGGSVKGAGQQVLGPPRKKTQHIVKDVFKGARDHGAEELSASTQHQESSGARTLAFSGAGRRLGESITDDMVVEGVKVPESAKRVDMVLKMWSNGFSINDGPLRDFRDPANQSFLEDIKRGQLPEELVREANGGELNLNLEDHHSEEYREPVQPKIRAFAGAGHVLGSPSPALTTSTAPAASAVAAQVCSPSASAPTIDASAPTTQVQLRLADGSRMLVKLNESHTVADIRAAIISQHAQYATSNFVLMTTFPNKELSDATKTLAEAGLLNASVVQRLR